MADRITAPGLIRMKQRGEKIVCLTAYDFTSALIAEAAGIDVLLVGDSMGNVIQGFDSTLPVELDSIAYHTAAVVRGSSRALVVADLPFGSYQVSSERAVENSIALMKRGAGAVKLEGAYTDEIRAIAKAGIPVMGHVGMTPQSVHAFGGFRVQGKGEAGDRVLQESLAIQEAGAFAIVLELIPGELSRRITAELRIPTIGIGGGPDCDGQIQVWQDVLGLNPQAFRHARAFVSGREMFISGLKTYADQVRSGEFPAPENTV